jgi:hypothetical protein
MLGGLTPRWSSEFALRPVHRIPPPSSPTTTCATGPLVGHGRGAVDRALRPRPLAELTSSPATRSARACGIRMGYPAFRRLCRKLKLDGVRLHDLRHWMATEGLGGGADIETVAGRGGWANSTTPLEVYSQFRPDDQLARQLAERLDSGSHRP